MRTAERPHVAPSGKPTLTRLQFLFPALRTHSLSHRACQPTQFARPTPIAVVGGTVGGLRCVLNCAVHAAPGDPERMTRGHEHGTVSYGTVSVDLSAGVFVFILCVNATGD